MVHAHKANDVKKPHGRGRTAAFTITFAMLACLGQFWFFAKVGTEILVRWHSVGTPPEQTLRIIGIGYRYDPKEVYVETVSHTIYRIF